MAYLTETERIRLIIEDPNKVPMSLAEIVTEEIREFRASEEYQRMVAAEQYYRNRSAVQGKTVEVTKRSNTKIEHPVLKMLVDQKANFLLAKPWTVETEDETYSAALNEIFDPTFRRKIKSLGKAAVKSGIAWLQPYFAEDRLQFMRIPATEIVPLWTDTEHTKLESFIRFYERIVYEGRNKKTLLRAEVWHSAGVIRFESGDSGRSFQLLPEYGTPANGFTEPHLLIGNTPHNWDAAPIVWLKYNEEEIPLLHFIQELIDDINWQTSVTSDVLRDIANFIYIIQNYGGADLEEFIADLRKYLAIKVEAEGGVEKLQADLNIEAVMAFLEKQRRDVYNYAAAVDTKDPELGNASGTAINFRYMDLQSDCEGLASELKDTFQQLKLFIDAYLEITGKGNFQNSEFDIVFNMDMPVNETDIINNAKSSVGLISNRTILQNHPWVDDAEAEMEQMAREKEEAMQLYGEGLFNQAMGVTGEDGDSNGQPDE